MKATERQKRATSAFMLRIAAAKIREHGLKDTPQEYVAKCQKRVAE